MAALFAYGVTLLVAVLVSGRAHRSVLSTAVIFLVAGFVAGSGITDWVVLEPTNPAVTQFVEVVLFAVLFTDGTLVGAREVVSAWRLPGRTLLLGLPLTLLVTAGLAMAIVGMPLAEAMLLGAALAPTDPVLAAAIVGREEVPLRLRRLLNVESGFNDGLALPLVVVLIEVVSEQPVEWLPLLQEVALGVAIGVAVPFVAIRLERLRFFGAAARYEPLNAFAIGVLILAVARMVDANEFLAAFTGGITIATCSDEVRDAFHRFGELVSELLKLGGLLVFGALITPQFFGEVSLPGYAFAAVALLLVRPAAITTSLLGSPLPWRERLVAAWFGPKGFASVVFGLLILKEQLPRSDELFHLVGLVVAASIVAHSSTDTLIAHWFEARQRRESDGEAAEGQVGAPEDPAAEGDERGRQDAIHDVPFGQRHRG